VFDGAKEVEIVIVQPPHIRRWVTTFDRINAFEQELMLAMYEAKKPNAKLQHGEHCRFCSAKPVCPVMTGAVDRALKVKVDSLDHDQINAYLKNADMLEDWITSLRDLAYNMVKGGATLPDWKLVAKRGTRKWADEGAACVFLINSIGSVAAYNAKIISPAQAEKELKKVKQSLPDELVVTESSGDKLVPADDPTPAIQQIGSVLTNALSKIVQ
jgi:hypothetical protein